jgi:hypothetical protein
MKSKVVGLHNPVYIDSQNGVCTTLLPPNADCNDEHSKQKRKSTRDRRDHNALANIKTAIMLFVVLLFAYARKLLSLY